MQWCLDTEKKEKKALPGRDQEFKTSSQTKVNRPAESGILIPAQLLGREVLSGSEISRNAALRCDQNLTNQRFYKGDWWQHTGLPTPSIWNSTKRDTRNKSRLPKPHKEVAADPKQRSHGMSERIAQKIHVRSLIPLLVGTAVRDGSLYSAYSRSQTDNFDSSAWYPNRERRQQLKQSK